MFPVIWDNAIRPVCAGDIFRSDSDLTQPMKLATRKDDTRDGQLTVVSRDLKHAVIAEQVTGSLQRALDDWGFIGPQLQDLYERLNQGKVPNRFDFDPKEYMAPLPRAFQHVQASAWPALDRRLQKAGMMPVDEGADEEELRWHIAPSHAMMPGHAPVSMRYPLSMPQVLTGDDGDEADETNADGQAADGASGDAAAARPAVQAVDPDRAGLDFGAQLVVICDDLAPGLSVDEAERGILLVGLANGWHYHPAAPFGTARRQGRGFAMAPVVVTPDELGEDWREGVLHRPLHCRHNGRSTGRVQAGNDMRFDFRQVLVTLARQMPVRAGCLVSGGPVANSDPDSGWTSLLEARARRVLEKSSTPGPAFMQVGDRIRIDMVDAKGQSLFGSIEQVVVA